MRNAPRFLGGRFRKLCSAVSYFSTLLGSIIGAGWLSFRVRDGSGRFPAAMAAVTLFHTCGVGVCLVVGCRCCLRGVRGCEAMFFYNNGVFVLVVVSFRPVSASSLQPLLVF